MDSVAFSFTLVEKSPDKGFLSVGCCDKKIILSSRMILREHLPESSVHRKVYR